MFNPSILELESQIQYHQEQQELAEQELDRLKMTQAFAEDAAEKVEDALEHIDPKYIEVFKEHLLALFPTEAPLSSHSPALSSAKSEAEYGAEYGAEMEAPIYLEEKEPVEVRKELYEKPHYPNPKIPIKLADYTPGQTPVNKVEIAPGIIYIPVDKTAFVAMKAKGRARTYGDMLTRVLDIGSKYLVTDKLTVIKDAKYEFRIFDIELDDIKQLAKFNLSKEYDHKENKEVREVWRTTRKREVPPAYKPSPKLTPLKEVKLGEIVYLNSITNQYKVLSKVELDGTPHIEVVCIFNSERPSLVSAISYLKECYLVPADEIQIDPALASDLAAQEEEETIAKTVELKPTVKKSSKLTTENFMAPPYQKISLDEIEVCDIVSTGKFVKAYYEIYQHNGSHVLGKCLHHDSLPMRIGQDGFYIKVPFLVEKAETSENKKAA